MGLRGHNYQEDTCFSFFPNTPQLFPDSQSFANPLSPTVKQFSQPESGFSKNVHTTLTTLAATEHKRIHAKALEFLFPRRSI